MGITTKYSGEPLESARLRYKASSGELFSITRVSYLLSGFALERTDGSWLELTNDIAWFDVETSRSSHRITSIPEGEYRALRFHIGPDANANHADVAQFPADHPLNPNLNNLHWSWQGGFIFMALEGMWQPGGKQSEEKTARALDGWAFHLARDANRTRITLAAPIDLNRDAAIKLDFDLATLLNAPRPISFSRDGSSTHSREGDSIAAALVANLPAAFRIRQVDSATPSRVNAASITPLYLPAKFTPYPFRMSATFPIPDLPRDNPLITERVAIGKKLFHEPLLSKDNTLSCASCHVESAAFTDPRRFSVGVREQVGTRNAMPLFNLAWRSSFFWDGRAPSLRTQALMPIQDHTEMDESLTNVIRKLETRNSKLETTSDYAALFTAAFGSPEITPEKIGLAIEAFVLTLTSFDSKFDRALAGKASLTDDEKRGLELFMTEYDPRRQQFGADCFHCHGGPLFQSQTFANNGLDSDAPKRCRICDKVWCDHRDLGRARVTGKDSDRAKFATPSLRNVGLTAPYMHDGRLKTLEEVVAHYSTGLKRSATLDPNLAKHPDGGVRLSESDQRALVAFLGTLTDSKYILP